ncbi:Loc1 protein [Martiniozyma asiatica (nom. inval.)]|nr:Loc1 protein [Martiniozyma asiatica]
MSINKQTKAAKRKGKMNGKREVQPEVSTDSVARNLMANTPNKTPKAAKRKLQGGDLKKHLRSAQLYGKKKELKKYTDKELGIPTLNKAILPGVIKKKGKKGKKFIGDGDNIILSRIIKQVNDDRDLVNESKLEKSKRLEEIRDLRRQEMERKEEEKKGKLEGVKTDIKKKANLARNARRKNAREAKKALEKEVSGKSKKSVSFA